MSSIPVLFAVQLGFALVLCARVSLRRALFVLVPILLVSAWGVLSGWAAWSGVYDSGWFLALWPGLWLPAVPIAIVLLTLSLPGVAGAVHDVARATPAHWLVAVQALRIAAVGTLAKTATGDFPLHVELAIGLTDLAFGVSALWVFFLARKQRVHPDALFVWHCVGIALILVPGNLALQLGLPGPLQVFATEPTAAVMLDWPMALAPTLVVPIFLLFNGLGALNARTQRLRVESRA